MKITLVDSYEDLSELGSNKIVTVLTEKPDALLCLATGETPKGIYSRLHEHFNNNSHVFEKFRIIKLDEWCDITSDEEASCEYYVNKHIISPLKVNRDRYFTYESSLRSAYFSCSKIRDFLAEKGPIDFLLLGLGVNGHLGLIEPNRILLPHAHVVKLSVSSQHHKMLSTESIKPTHGITLGIAEIFEAKKVILIVSGNHKKHIVKKLLQGNVSTKLPASLLWLHHNSEIIVDKEIFYNAQT